MKYPLLRAKRFVDRAIAIRKRNRMRRRWGESLVRAASPRPSLFKAMLGDESFPLVKVA